MPSARPRALEDSRSETSSTITNLKDRYAAVPVSSSLIPKNKKATTNGINGPGVVPKPLVNGVVAAQPESDPNLPRTDWQSMPRDLLHSYRHAYRLSTPSSHAHPHAEHIYKSSRTALRAPSAVHTRRRLRDLKHERRKGTAAATTTQPNGKYPMKEKDIKDRERSSDRLKNNTNITILPPPLYATDAPLATKQPQSTLASAVRRHFNAQQLNETDVISRFLYVVHHSSAAATSHAVRTPGSDGDGRGAVMGSHGRAVQRNDGAGRGGELGFRLRFRPEPRG